MLELVTLSNYVIDLESQYDHTAGFSKVYVEIRSAHLHNAVLDFTEGESMRSSKKDDIKPLKNFGGFIKKVVETCNMERNFLLQVISAQELDRVWMDTCKPVFELFLNTMEFLIKEAKGNLFVYLFDVIELYDAFEEDKGKLGTIFEKNPRLHSMSGLSMSMKAAMISYFPEFYGSLQVPLPSRCTY